MKKEKLVRDKIPEIIKKEGKNPITRIATNEEYIQELINKLQEEVDEFKENKKIEELADITEVIYAISEHFGIPVANLHNIREAKAKERGKIQE
jgi:predicted house-cleaning noncanonical NTP pyrophosphatase (MazG superfamily)